MPKKRMLKVLADPQPKPGVSYKVLVMEVKPLDDILRVTVRHLSHGMAGFTRALDLQLPLSPGSLAGALFKAAGVALQLDGQVDPQSINGALVAAEFAVLPGADHPQPAAFSPVANEDAHVQ